MYSSLHCVSSCICNGQTYPFHSNSESRRLPWARHCKSRSRSSRSMTILLLSTEGILQTKMFLASYHHISPPITSHHHHHQWRPQYLSVGSFTFMTFFVIIQYVLSFWPCMAKCMHHHIVSALVFVMVKCIHFIETLSETLQEQEQQQEQKQEQQEQDYSSPFYKRDSSAKATALTKPASFTTSIVDTHCASWETSSRTFVSRSIVEPNNFEQHRSVVYQDGIFRFYTL